MIKRGDCAVLPLVDESWDRLTRARLLPHQVTIALAVGDLDTARVAATELAASAETYGSKAFMAAAEYTHGELALVTSEGRATVAAPQRRVMEAARLERALARECFERLGAKLDAEITDQLAVIG